MCLCLDKKDENPEAIDDDVEDDIKYFREEVQAEPEPGKLIIFFLL